MKHRRLILVLAWAALCTIASAGDTALVVHGGAGYLSKGAIEGERGKAYGAAVKRALAAGDAILKKGGSSTDAVVAAIKILEDSPIFNAGKGSVFTSEGKNELDASVMDGKTRQAGAVGGVTTIKNPIEGARAVMDKSPHVMMAGEGAEKFAKEQGLDLVERSYFRTEEQWQRYQKSSKKFKSSEAAPDEPARYFGTVGAVALDKEGNIAAGTSTGGLMNKQFGRIGDSPIIAAGTYADNATCGISSTGHGEFFIRYAVAYDVSARMKYAKQSLEEAAKSVVHGTLSEAKGAGGVIGLDGKGNVVMEFNTPSMVRGWIDTSGKTHVAFLKE